MEQEVLLFWLTLVGTFLYLGFRALKAVWDFMLKALKIGAVIGVLLMALFLYLTQGVWIL